MPKYRIRCWFHDDRNPSAFYDTDTNVYYCSKCGGINLEKAKERSGKTSLGDIEGEAVSDSFTGAESSTESLAEILARNGQTLGSISEYLEPGGQTKYPDYLSFRGAGGVSVRRYIGTDPGSPRYDNPIGSKRLFNFKELKDNSVLLVEGLWDLLACQSIIDMPVAATLGAPSKEQLYSLYGKTVFIAFDNDYAGWHSAQEASKTLLEMRAKPIVLNFRLAKDPGECHDFGDRTRLREWLLKEIGKYTFGSTYQQAIPLPVDFRPTPWEQFNEKLGGGLSPGSHLFLGGPGSGKSMLLSNFAKYFAGTGAKTTVATYELSVLEFIARMQAESLGVEWLAVLQGKANIRPMPSALKVVFAPSLGELQHYLDVSDVLIIDYIQQMAKAVSKDASEARNAIDSVVPDMVAFANEKGKVMISAAAVRKGHYHKKTMEAKDSGSLEYSASSVTTLQRFKDRLYLHIAKNRYGQLGKVALEANWPRGVFR